MSFIVSDSTRISAPRSYQCLGLLMEFVDMAALPVAVQAGALTRSLSHRRLAVPLPVMGGQRSVNGCGSVLGSSRGGGFISGFSPRRRLVNFAPGITGGFFVTDAEPGEAASMIEFIVIVGRSDREELIQHNSSGL
jgi:hypothetical protein